MPLAAVAPLDAERRKALLLIEMYQRKEGRAPLWSEIRTMSGAKSERQFAFLMLGLRKKGLVTFGDEVKRSTRVTPAGLQAALAKGETR